MKIKDALFFVLMVFVTASIKKFVATRIVK